MKSTTTACTALAAAALVALAAGCGKKSQEEQEQETHAAAQPAQTEESLPTDAVPFGESIEEAGLEVTHFNAFPSPVAGHKGRLILYRSESGGGGGGMIFVDQSGADTRWVWHWYFDDQRPERFERLDLNKDGLWDIRVFADNGGQFDLIHDQDFLLGDYEREDRIALNGTSSEPEGDNPLWHCFDGSVRSAWVSSMKGDRPFIELDSPMGLTDGILSIRSADENQPRECTVYADGKKVQEFELRATTDEQLVQLDSKLHTAKKIRLEIKSCHGDAEAAAVVELKIK